MRSAVVIMIVAAVFAVARAGTDYDAVSRKASRFFDNGEWASAGALYGLMLDESPDDAWVYGRAAVSCMMSGDTLRSMDFMSDAMSHGVSLDSVLLSVGRASREIGHGELYEAFLYGVQDAFPWLSRPIDAYLLRYYTFRNDAPMMIRYASAMLQGLPDNTAFLSILARGYMLEGRDREAMAVWEHIISIDGDNYDALICAGNLYAMIPDPEKALPLLERAFALRPTPYVGTLLEEQRRMIEAGTMQGAY